MDQDLLTLFISVTALAVLIQSGILVGFYVVSTKLSQKLDDATRAAGKLIGPLQTKAESLQAASATFATVSTATEHHLRELEDRWRSSKA